ncbi:Nucleoside-diphosphate-sugar epimerase [Giardia lamblia P15]|uniref:Nucleoside-diphosphate-sugar epimerase n=1 Tax=Giardia intestinalis (strain P15) TaxID=658858 RepID=E1F5D1_GIAIA|nr:Nucleoside-diphosphate-sugar epimerase [Giardia lamblia P15]
MPCRGQKSIDDSTILLTGATGFIGLALVSELIKRGASLICMHRKTSDTTGLLKLFSSSQVKHSLCECDFDDPLTVEQAIRHLQFDTVVHLAAVSAWNDLARVDAYDSSFAYTKTLISALTRTTKHVNFIYISSAAAGPARRTLSEKPLLALLNYASAKRDTETFLLKQSSDIVRRLVILRLAETYGPNDDRLVTAGNIMEYIHKRLSFVTPGGLSILHRDDAVRTIANAISTGTHGHIYYVGGEDLTIAELAREISKLCGTGTLSIQLPRALIKPLVYIGRILHLTNYPQELTEYVCTYWFGDNKRAEIDLGHTHRPARDTLRDVVSWLQACRGYSRNI